jgi:tetratricopeptide (TPR) repeat protein
LGLIDLETGAFAASERQFQQALSCWSGLDKPTQLARTWLNLGTTYQWQGRLVEAKRCYEQAHEVLLPTANVVDKLKVLNGLGTLHYMAAAFVAAEMVFRQGLAEARQLQGLYHLRGSLNHNLGNTLLALGRWGEARLYLEKSILLWRQANDEVEQANSMGTLAELDEQQGEWATAVAHYEAALRLLLPYPEHQWAQKLTITFQAARERCAAQNSAAMDTR